MLTELKQREHGNIIHIRKWASESKWDGKPEYRDVLRLTIGRDLCGMGSATYEYVEPFNVTGGTFVKLKRFDGSTFLLNTDWIINAEKFKLVTVRLIVTGGIFPDKRVERCYVIHSDETVVLDE